VDLNEQADRLAVAAATEENVPKLTIIVWPDVKLLIKRKFESHLQELWEKSQHFAKFNHRLGKKINDLKWTKNREQERKIYQLICNCYMTNGKLHMLQKLSSPLCDYCGRLDSMTHRFMDCPRYRNYRLQLFQVLEKPIVAEEDILDYNTIVNAKSGPLLVLFC